jgi:dienelactone hydrolase
MRRELPRVIGLPQFPPLGESFLRGRVRVGEDVLCERVDVYGDEDYAIPVFVLRPASAPETPRPALVFNPGWPQTKWEPAYLAFAQRMARQGMAVLILDHAPFGETSPAGDKLTSMTLVMGMGQVLGISQLALRAAETMRCGEYLRSRPDVEASRVAVAEAPLGP